MALSDRLRWAVGLALALTINLSQRYRAMNTYSKVAVWAYAGLHLAMVALVLIVTPARLFALLAIWADTLREMTFGWLLLLVLIIVTSMPPAVGYGTCITLCGFSFGVWHGWLIAMSGCLMGAVVAFLTSRRLISLFAPLLARDKTFKALAAAVRAKGLPLVVLIRLCPFPFPYSNAFFASIESVSLLHFFIATLAITPKLFLHVWVGSRMFLFADPSSREHMDSNTKIINGIYVVFGTLLGGFTSWYLYRLTMQYVQEIALEEGNGDLEAEAGLLNDIDDMLDGEDDESDGGGHDERGIPLMSRSGVVGAEGEEEENWDRNFSFEEGTRAAEAAVDRKEVGADSGYLSGAQSSTSSTPTTPTMDKQRRD